MKWEDIDDWNSRAWVYGGWIVRTYEPVYHVTDTQSGDGWDWRISTVFVPDPDRKWQISDTEDS